MRFLEFGRCHVNDSSQAFSDLRSTAISSHSNVFEGKHMLRLFSISVAFLAISTSVTVAEWRVGPGSEIFLGTDSAFGVSHQGVHAVGIMCRNNAPMLWTQGYPSAAGANREESFEVSVDGRSFALTGEHAPPDGLWTGEPSTELIDALKAGSNASVKIPRQIVATYSLRGSSRALGRVLADCSAASDAKTEPETETARSRVILTGQLIANACGGSFTFADGAEFTGFLDGDDKPDIVLDWGGVTCDDPSKGRGAGFCGAALCTIEVALTQTQSRRQILGLDPERVDRGFGRHALKTNTQGAACGGGAQACQVIWRWTGKSLEAIR